MRLSTAAILSLLVFLSGCSATLVRAPGGNSMQGPGVVVYNSRGLLGAHRYSDALRKMRASCYGRGYEITSYAYGIKYNTINFKCLD